MSAEHLQSKAGFEEGLPGVEESDDDGGARD